MGGREALRNGGVPSRIGLNGRAGSTRPADGTR